MNLKRQRKYKEVMKMLKSLKIINGKHSITFLQVYGAIDSINTRVLEQVLKSSLSINIYRFIIKLNRVGYIGDEGRELLESLIYEIRAKGGDIKLLYDPSGFNQALESLEKTFLLSSFTTLEAAISDFDLTPEFSFAPEVGSCKLSTHLC
ncbi:hypothetical protein IH970_12150 [candidate division KSB1 bacterium]|nr:hypothetical protein [candidate division KSB1 bacterium]